VLEVPTAASGSVAVELSPMKVMSRAKLATVPPTLAITSISPVSSVPRYQSPRSASHAARSVESPVLGVPMLAVRSPLGLATANENPIPASLAVMVPSSVATGAAVTGWSAGNSATRASRIWVPVSPVAACV
jgi:hypothetical protein